jgi:subtilase family serine protease
VLAAGGTALTASSSTGAYIGKTAWGGETSSFSQDPLASGDGFSHRYARPAYQDGGPRISTARGVPDVAGEADDQGGWPSVFAAAGWPDAAAEGTTASAALWGGLMALADQDAHHDLGFVNPAIYRIAGSSSYHKAFHDITTGNNILLMPYPARTTGYRAGPGWDPVTGWGTPDAQVLVPLLARLTSRSKA